MKYKEIKLNPTLFYLDVYVGTDQNKLQKAFNEFYGISWADFVKLDIEGNCVHHVKSTEDSKFKGANRIIMLLEDFDVAIVFHEIIHVLFRLEHFCNIGINSESQEWVACMVEYIYNEYNKDNYTTINE